MVRFGVAVIALGLSTAACGSSAAREPSVAKLSGHWVLAAPGGFGQAKQPTYGDPLQIEDAGNACASRAALDQRFGKPCDKHETEGGAQQGPTSPPLTDEVGPGIAPTPGEPVWYCNAGTVTRVALKRCDTADTFTVSQIAVLIRE